MPSEGEAKTFVANCITFTALYHETDGNYYPVLVDGKPLTSGRVDGANWSKIKFFIKFKRGSSDDAVTWHSASNGGDTGSVGTDTYYVSYYKPGATYPFHLKTGNSTGSTNQGWITTADFRKFCTTKPTILYYKNNSDATGTTNHPLAESNSNRSGTTSPLAQYNNSQNLYNVATLFKLTGHRAKSDAEAWRIGSSSSTTYADQDEVNLHSKVSASDYDADGNYIKLYANWERISYTITYNLNGGTASGDLKTSYSVASTTFTLPQVTKTGYTFTGWTGSNGTTPQKTVTITKGSTTGDKTYTANFTANTNTPYQVKHWQQKIDGGSTQNSTNFELANTENKTGTTAASVTPAVKSYTGFTSPSASSLTIKADGTAVKHYYYTRNSYNLVLNKGTGISSVSGAGLYQYGKSVTINATASTGYYWTGWTGTKASTTKNYTFTMPAQAVTNTANAVAKTLTVQYQKNDGSGDTDQQSFTYGANSSDNQKFGYKLDGTTKEWPAEPNSYCDLYGFGRWCREGYKIIGWATSATGSATLTPPYYAVKNAWINTQVGDAASKTIQVYAVWDYNGTVRIYKDGAWKMALPYIYTKVGTETSPSWHLALPYTYAKGTGETSPSWHLNGG